MSNFCTSPPPPPFFLFLYVRMGPNWVRPPLTPGRRNLGYQPPPPTTSHAPIPFGILTAYQLHLVSVSSHTMQVQFKTLYN